MRLILCIPGRLPANSRTAPNKRRLFYAVCSLVVAVLVILGSEEWAQAVEYDGTSDFVPGTEYDSTAGDSGIVTVTGADVVFSGAGTVNIKSEYGFAIGDYSSTENAKLTVGDDAHIAGDTLNIYRNNSHDSPFYLNGEGSHSAILNIDAGINDADKAVVNLINYERHAFEIYSGADEFIPSNIQKNQINIIKGSLNAYADASCTALGSLSFHGPMTVTVGPEGALKAERVSVAWGAHVIAQSNLTTSEITINPTSTLEEKDPITIDRIGGTPTTRAVIQLTRPNEYNLPGQYIGDIIVDVDESCDSKFIALGNTGGKIIGDLTVTRGQARLSEGGSIEGNLLVNGGTVKIYPDTSQAAILAVSDTAASTTASISGTTTISDGEVLVAPGYTLETTQGIALSGGMLEATEGTLKIPTGQSLAISGGTASLSGTDALGTDKIAGGIIIDGGELTFTGTANLTDANLTDRSGDGKIALSGTGVIAAGVLNYTDAVDDRLTLAPKATLKAGSMTLAGKGGKNFTVEGGTLISGGALSVADGSGTLTLGDKTTLALGASGQGALNTTAVKITDGGAMKVESGEWTVATVNVGSASGGSLRIGSSGDGAAKLTVTKELASVAAGDGSLGINVLGNAVLSVANDILFDEHNALQSALEQIYLANGALLEITGLNATLDADALAARNAALLTPDSAGLIKYADSIIDDGNKDDVDGIPNGIRGETLENTHTMRAGKIAVYDAKNTSAVASKGNFGADTLTIINANAEGMDDIAVNGNLTLLGDGDSLVAARSADGTAVAVANVTVAAGKNLNLGSAGVDATTQGGTLRSAVTLNGGSGLHASVGVYTVGEVDGGAAGEGIVSSSGGATLTAASIGAANGVATVEARGGDVVSQGDIITTALRLQDGNVRTTGGDIRVAGSIADASGSLTAAGNGTRGGGITLTGGITKAPDGMLALKADTIITAADITATSVRAKTLTARDVTVDGGALELPGDGAAPSTANNMTLRNGARAVVGSFRLNDATGALTVGTENDATGGTTLSAAHVDLNGGMLLVDPAWGLASTNVAIADLSVSTAATDIVALNGSVGAGRNSYLAVGTMDLNWLPDVVAKATGRTALVEGGVESVLGLYKPITIAAGSALRVDGAQHSSQLHTALTNGRPDTATFAGHSLLVVNGADAQLRQGAAAITFAGSRGSVAVNNDAQLYVADAVEGVTYKIVDGVDTIAYEGGSYAATTGWKGKNLLSSSGMVRLTSENGQDFHATRNDARSVFPGLSDGMASAVDALYTGLNGRDRADVLSSVPGVRFLSRATDNRYLSGNNETAKTIESAARIAFAGAAPQMTRMAADATADIMINRLSPVHPSAGIEALDSGGRPAARDHIGLALWIAPLWRNTSAHNLEAGELDYSFNGNLGGVALGADYTFENAIRAGITLNAGGGYAKAGGDFNATANNMKFWGVGAYLGWSVDNFALMVDTGYTSAYNKLRQDLNPALGMADLKADVQTGAWHAGLRTEYKLQTTALDIIPHLGVRYMNLHTQGYDVTSSGTVLHSDGSTQNIWTFPAGVTFSKDIPLESGWSFRPSLDFSAIPAAGDIKAKHNVAFSGLPGSYGVKTQTMDNVIWQGDLGIEVAKDNFSMSVNYTLQAGQHSTGHGVFAMFRYEF